VSCPPLTSNHGSSWRPCLIPALPGRHRDASVLGFSVLNPGPVGLILAPDWGLCVMELAADFLPEAVDPGWPEAWAVCPSVLA
jgi:hypothetical protein